MKKSLVLFILLILIAGVGVLYFWGDIPLGLETDMTEVFPDEPLIFLRVEGLSEGLDKFKESGFYANLRTVNMDAFLRESKMPDAEKRKILNAQDQFDRFLTDPTVRQFLGHEFAAGIYSEYFSLESVRNMSDMSQWASNFYFATRIHEGLQFAEFISRFFQQNDEDFSTSSEEYNGMTVHHVLIKETGTTVSYTRIKDILVFGLSGDIPKTSIDVYQGGDAALKDDGRFGTVRDRYLDSAGTNAFFNMAKLGDLFQEQVEAVLARTQDTDPAVKQSYEESLQQLDGFTSWGYSSKTNGKIQIKFDIFFDPDELAENISMFYSRCRSTKNGSLAFIPKDVLAYHWGSCFYLDQYWDQYKKEMERANELARAQEGRSLPAFNMDQMQQSLGVDVENDILPVFGDEFGGFLTDIKVGGMFPIPDLLLFVAIEDQAKAESLLGRLTKNPMMMINEEDHGGVAVKYVTLPLGGDLQPAYAFLDRYLLIAVKKSTIQDAVDAFRDAGLSLAQNKQFKEAVRDLPGKSISTFFVDVDTFNSKVRAIIEWGSRWAASRYEKQRAFRSGTEQRLEDIRIEIENLRAEIVGTESSIEYLRERIVEYRGRGLDTAQMERELAQMEEDILDKKNDIRMAEEQERETALLLENYSEPPMDPQAQRAVLDDVIYPLIEAFSTLDAVVSKTTATGEMFESYAVIDVKD